MSRKNRYQKLLEARNRNNEVFNSGFYSTPINQSVINPFDLPIAEDGAMWEPWKTTTSGYNLETLDGEDFDENTVSEFTTSKIERDRKKNWSYFA